MKLFPWQKNTEFFTEEEKNRIVTAIQESEKRTSGEIRIFIESRCRYVNPLDRALEVFANLKMDATELRNGTLVYVAVKDHQAAVYGDAGIHQKVGQKYWEEEVNKMMLLFKEHHLAEGLIQVITDIGEVLYQYFPYNRETDKNELPDDIVFGR
ncbi:MAG TPA: TPM domain-containing protein [Chitinophagaceae bacterium]|nr:TPM domain-containing protein [Chitinophagaceae bacterium]